MISFEELLTMSATDIIKAIEFKNKVKELYLTNCWPEDLEMLIGELIKEDV